MTTVLSAGHWQRPALIFLLAAIIANNALWFCLGGSPLHWDSSVHLLESLRAFRVLTSADVSLKQLLYFSWYYPPFVSWASIPFYAIFGEGLFASSLVMTSFLTVLVLGTYALGARLFDTTTGVLSAVFVSSFPIVLDFSRQFMLDMPLAAMVALSLYFTIRSEKFARTGWSCLLGIALGFGFLTKWTFPFFLLFPLVYQAGTLLHKNAERSKRVQNVILSLAIAFVISLPWYFVHIVQILAGRSGQLAQGSRSIFDTVIFYILALPQETSWLLFFALAAGIVLLFRLGRSPDLVLILSIAGGYILLTIVNFKMPRFAMPLLPPLTVLACGGIVRWVTRENAPRAVRLKAAFALAMLVLLQNLATTYVPANSTLGKIIGKQVLSASIVPVQGPQDHNWQQRNILQTIAGDSLSHRATRRILRVIPDYLYFNAQSFELVSELDRFPVSVSSISGFPLFTDYAVLKTGEVGEDTAHRQSLSARILADSSLFEFMRSFLLPDGSEAILLRVRVLPNYDIPADTIKVCLEQTANQFIRHYLKPRIGYSIEVQTEKKDDLQKGRLVSLRVRATQAEFGDFTFNPIGVTVRNVDMELTDVLFNPNDLVLHKSLQLLSIQQLHVRSFEVDAADLKDYLVRSSKGRLVINQIGFEHGTISLTLLPEQPRLRLEIALQLQMTEHQNLTFNVRKLKLGGIPILPAFVNSLLSSYNPLLNGLKQISEVRIGRLSIGDERLTIIDTDSHNQPSR